MSFLNVGFGSMHYQLLECKPDAEAFTPGSPTVVFIHGLIMDNLSSWFFTVANPVAQFANALVYDMRGHGFTDRPPTGYGISDHVQDLKRLVSEVVGDGPLILVGNSFGGLIALNYAASYRDQVAGIVLIDAQVNDEAWKAQMLASFSLQGEERDQMVVNQFQNWAGRNSKRKSNKLVENAKDLVHRTSLMDDIRNDPFLDDDVLGSIPAHCFAIYGGESDILSTAHRLERVLPNCDLEVVDGSTHSVLWEQTERVKAWILDSIQTLIAEGTVGSEPSRSTSDVALGALTGDGKAGAHSFSSARTVNESGVY